MIVFTLGGARQAAELRWVREVISLGFVTAVPTAPPGLTGAFNLRGHLVPVLDIGALTPGGTVGPAPRQGDGALLVEIDGVTAALRVDKVEEVATLASSAAAVTDTMGRTLPLIDPPALVRRAVAESHAVRGADGGAASVDTSPGSPPDPTTGARPRAPLDGDSTLG